ncbi:MFS transporter [Polycladomyces sp. WAk]|uniref:MFS transporter n=2 Tax=Polycladomyces zharkentensis TaxID=2807616 RepID=A0ABS2WKR8_9BACL|nr:MFS transporter [Polycladomyces sp. WAk]MBN2910061.1 MFS transporter [Polycladomyces sp. WAk]
MQQDRFEAPPSSSYRWMILAVATWVQATATLVTYGVGPLAAIWQKQWGLSAAQAGLLVSAVQVGPLLSMLLIGHALDRYGERWLVSLGACMLGMTFFLVSFTTHYLLLLLLLGIVGIWYGTAQPGGSKVILRWFPKKERGLAMGVRQAGIPIGGAIGGTLLPYLSLHFGWPSAVYAQSVLAVAGGLLFLALYREPQVPPKHQRQTNSRFRQKIKAITSNRKMLPILCTGMIMVTLQMVLVGHLMLFFGNEKKTGLVIAGQLLSTALISGMAGRIVLAHISDRWWGGNRESVLHLSIWASVFGVTALIFLPAVPPVWSLFVLSAWLGFFGIGWFSSFLLAVAEQAPPQSEGLMVSYALTLNQVAIILAPALFGWIADLTSYSIAWSLLVLLLLGNGLLLAKKRREDVG